MQLFISGAWTDIPLYSAGGWTHQRGHAPYGEWPRPTSFTCEINNDTLAYDPDRPESVLYGVAGRTTPARLLINTAVRLQGEAQIFRPVRSPEHQPGTGRGRASVQFTAAGALQRVSEWTEQVRSPLLRTLSALTNRLGHWPLEEDENARSLANTQPLGYAGTIKGAPDLADSQRPAGARQTVKLINGCQLSGIFAASTTSGWQIAWSMKMPSLPAGNGRIMRWRTTNGYTWTVDAGPTGWTFNAVAADGTVVWTSAVIYGGADPTQWVAMRIKVSVSGGTVTVEPAWYRRDLGIWGATGTFSGSIGQLVQWWHDGNATADGWNLSHVYGVAGVTDDLLSGPLTRAFDAHTGERALARAARIIQDELGLAYVQVGANTDTPKMGPQPLGTAVEILRECRATDGGRIDDEPTAAQIRITTRRSMMGVTPVLTLTYPTQPAIPFLPDPERAYVANVVTVKNRDAGEALAALTSGPMSSAPPPGGVGESRVTVAVNLYDEATDLAQRASWELARGTVGGRQFLNVSVDLKAGTVSNVTAAGVSHGDVILVTGYPPADLYLHVVGITESGDNQARTITWECEPYDIHRVGKWSDGTWRWGLGKMTVAAATSTATAWTVSSPDKGDMIPGGVPFDVVAGEERVTVTAAAAFTGTGPYTQVLTVTRSVNGVVKPQTAGTPVRVFNGRRWGWGTL